MPLENRRDVLIALATDADRLGYEAFCLPETWAYDVTVLLAEAAVKTKHITLGTGILGVWNRSAGTLGLGASTPQLTEGLHDVSFTAPVAPLRRIVTQVRALLRGERIPLERVPAARALKLNLPSGPDVPIFLAALADESVRLAGELADGWLPFLYPRSHLAAGRTLLAEGAARRREGTAELIVAPSVPTAVAEDAAVARQGAAWFVAFYLTTMGALYRQSLVRRGFAKEVEAVLAANTPRFTGEIPEAAESLLEELTVFGTPAQARARLARWHAAGADLPVLLLRPQQTPAEIALTLDAFRPMLAAGAGARVCAAAA